MNELPALLVSFAAGAGLGLAFFGGLWLTVRGLAAAPHPAARLLGSMLLRFAVAVAGFYLLARYAGWEHVLAAAIGFSAARLAGARSVARRSGGKELDA